MNVLIVSHYILPHIGGVERFIDYEIRSFVKQDKKVTVVASNIGGLGDNPTYDKNVHLIRLRSFNGLENFFNIPYPFLFPSGIAMLWSEVGKCDFLHTHVSLSMPSLLAILFAWIRKKPHMLSEYTTYNSLGLKAVFNILGFFFTRRAYKLCSDNTRVLEGLERLAGTREKSVFLPVFIDTKLFYPPSTEERKLARKKLGWETERPRVLFVGRLIDEKGVSLLLEAIDESYDIVFCAPGDKSRLGKLPRPGVEYLTPRPHHEMVRIYQASDLFVLPSSREGFPVSAREAIACGLRVLLLYDRGFKPYENLGLIHYSEKSPVTLKNAILKLLSEKASPSSFEIVQDDLNKIAFDRFMNLINPISSSA